MPFKFVNGTHSDKRGAYYYFFEKALNQVGNLDN